MTLATTFLCLNHIPPRVFDSNPHSHNSEFYRQNTISNSYKHFWTNYGHKSRTNHNEFHHLFPLKSLCYLSLPSSILSDKPVTPDRSSHHHPSNWRLHYWNMTMKQAWISPIFKDFLRNPSSQPNYMPQEQHPSKRSQKWFLTISLIYPSQQSFSHTTNIATVPNSSTSRRHIINLNYIQFTKFISKNFFLRKDISILTKRNFR